MACCYFRVNSAFIETEEEIHLKQAKDWTEMAVSNAPHDAHMHYVHALVLSASPTDFAAADAAFAEAFRLQPGMIGVSEFRCF